MAIAYDSSNFPAKGVSTWSHTCNGSNRALLVFISTSSTTGPTAITYNGVSLTKITDYQGSWGLQSCWILVGPAASANNVVVTGLATNDRCSSLSYSGVKQSAQPDSYTGNMDNGVMSLNINTTVNANCMLIVFGQSYSSTLTSNDNIRQVGAWGSAPYYMIVSDTNNGDNYITISNTETNAISGVAISLAPYIAPAQNPDFFAFF